MDLISTQEAGRRLGVSFWTVARWARLGILPSIKISRRRLFDPADLDEFIRQMKRNTEEVRSIKKPADGGTEGEGPVGDRR